ncbi:MAG: guanylate kinase [Myxococcota bacterium]
MRKGNPIVVSAASGTGKTSLCRRLLLTLSHTARSVSFTTRSRRGEEVDGRDYYFISDDEFDRMIEEGEFIEWAQVFTQRYGTGWRAVQQQLEEGIDVLLDIDVQGGLQIREKIPNAVLIFLLPPSMTELRRRLVNRAEDTAEAIELRLAKARNEIVQAKAYDYLVVNDDFDQAELDLRAIIRTHRIAQNPPLDLLHQLLDS